MQTIIKLLPDLNTYELKIVFSSNFNLNTIWSCLLTSVSVIIREIVQKQQHSTMPHNNGFYEEKQTKNKRK